MCSTCDGLQEYRYGPGTRVTEVAPKVCHHGHQLGPGRVSVGHEHGKNGGNPHRTYRCWACHDAGYPDAVLRFELR